MTNTQSNLDLDTFQPNEVRQLICELQFSHLQSRLLYPDADPYGFDSGFTVTETVNDSHVVNAGLILNDAEMIKIKANLSRIIERVKENATKDFSRLKDFKILNVNMKYIMLPVFNTDEFLS